ncbi:amino acid racemase [Caulobacter sp. NIBR1757]|uniref:aspartate/glutamate racemase family protein n=1 Tax=Caulobacter sp. NIBR1757 TaxID=3016000 RepID=UPI0022F083DA|nr:amino acid racemase [Caulobacter sp. NIBR1757]WGM39035.1 Broad specificity amino-acid racemase RacX [Caulobacter sp. NIBR1757]
MKILGVLGGMGPAATLDFLAKLQAATPAARDQDHLRVLMDLNPQVPDRNVEGGAAGPVLAEMAVRLREAGAEVLAMPCNTAHLHAEEIRAASGLPLLDLIDLAIAAAGNARRIGVLGTRLALDLYRTRLTAAGREPILPTEEAQSAFMDILYRIKSGDTGPTARALMAACAGGLEQRGAEAIIAGCTEVPLVLSADDLAVPLIDGSAELARACVAACR